MVKTIPFKQPHSPGEKAGLKMGIDRQRVAAYVGIAVIAGFGLGFATARFLISSNAALKADPIKGISGTEAPDRESDPNAATAGESVKVSRIIRADTIEVEGVGPVKMIGIETPDGKSPEKIYEKHGRNAMAFVERTLLGRQVRIESDSNNESKDHRDDSGHRLAYVYTSDGRLFNRELVEQGLAFVRTADKFKLVEDFRNRERDAMQAMRGVWGLSDGGSSPVADLGAEAKQKRLTPLLPSELDSRPQPPALLTPSTEPMVFISAEDRIYHKENCEYAGKKKQALPLSQAKSQGYSSCGRCFASTVLRAH